MADNQEKSSKEEVDSQDGARMPFLGHLEELRRRLIICFLAIGIGFAVSYYFSKPIFRILIRPLIDALPEGDRLIYTNLPEAFFTYLKLGLWGGIILALPVIFYQLWHFVAPGLYRNERRYFIPFVFWSCVLFIVGAVFGYFIVFPLGFRFFLGFADESIQALPAVAQYFSFSLKLLFGFGLIFELPVVMVFLAKMGLVNAPFLARQRKYAFLLIFVVGAILTPPDVISQVLMALPLMFLYEVSIFLVRLVWRKKDKKSKEAAV
ncbi:MAG: twin-arginine translocase subunit TatC [Deltaproteobacteria bacterium]|nr:twin-arginine translocase subunit TatC [Deltaproteobacteria bacterium]MBW2323408.1 twin-arginine translocase subunit TatC [Deltaproteobacteria bacterium]